MYKSRSRQAMMLGYIPIALLSLVIILFSIYSTHKVCEESEFVIKKIFSAKILSTEILTSLANEETNMIDYIISGDKDIFKANNLGDQQIQNYYDSLNNLKGTSVDFNSSNQLNQQIESIQNFFTKQMELLDNGKLYEAKLNLDHGKYLIDEFRVSNNILTKNFDLEIANSHNKVITIQKIQQYLLILLDISLIWGNIIFIKHIWYYMYGEVDKKNQMNKELEKLIVSQEEFIANISHELKTPLNVIFSAVQLVKRYCHNGSLDEKREKIIECVDSMKINSYRLSKLINNIIDSSKIKAGLFELSMSNNNIVELIEAIVTEVTIYRNSEDLNIIFDTDIEEKIIACDPEKIERVVLNLISNAIKYSEAGKEIYVNIQNKNEFVEISVKDNGIGIESNYVDVIFDKFRQVNKSLSRNTEGTGIGLHLIKSIIELHEGHIFVESEFGEGSKFTFTLPSKKVIEESIPINRNLKTRNELIQLELSDIYL